MKNKAFTIVELVVVIAVIAILAAVLIPTFGNVVQSAKISADKANANTYSLQLNLFVRDNGYTITSENASDILKNQFLSQVNGEISPQSAQFGYHYYYNFSNGAIELKHNSEVFKGNSQSVSVSDGTVNTYGWSDALPETCFLKDNYYLLDTTGSLLAETVNAIYGIEKVGDLQTIVGTQLAEADKEAMTYIKGYLDSVAFVSDGANFTTSDNATSLLFTDNATNVTSLKDKVGTDGSIETSYVSLDKPLATLAEGTVVHIPSTVATLSANSLIFATTGNSIARSYEPGIVLQFDDNAQQAIAKMDVGFTNCSFRFNDSADLFKIDEDDGSKVVNVSTGEVVATLTEKYPVASFEIAMDGNIGNVFSVALDKAEPSYQLKAVNFKNTDGESVVSDTSVRWSIDETSTAQAEIDEVTGVLKLNGVGTVVVNAVSESNPSASANFTVRAGGVINTSSITFEGVDGNLETIDGRTSKVKIINGQLAVFKYFVNVVTNYEDIDSVDTTYTVTSDGANAVVNSDGTIAVDGLGNFTITLKFNEYDVERSHNFVVEEKIEAFDCIKYGLPNVGQYLYKAGNLNSFDITKLWDFTGLHVDEGLNQSDIEIGYKIINAKNNQELSQVYFTLSKDNMLQFNDGYQGVVRIEITASSEGVTLNTVTVPLEILDGYNVTTYDELISTSNNTSNKMVLNDITLTAYRSNGQYVVNGAALYGNGFTLDGTKATHSSQMTWDALISVQNAVVDNAVVLGNVFPEITWTNGAYSAYTLYLSNNANDPDDKCEVYNSYFYGSRAAACVQVESYVSNTVFEGGVLANLVVENNVTLEDVTTIQNTASDNIQGDITEDNIDKLGIGLGIFVDSSFANNVTITLEGDLIQYNWIDTELIGKLGLSYQVIFESLLSKFPQFIHRIEQNSTEKQFVNAGMVFAATIADGNKVVVDNRTTKDEFPYMFNGDSGLGFSGAIFTLSNGTDGNIEDQRLSGEKIANNNRFDSNSYVRTLSSINTSPEIILSTESIDTGYSATVTSSTLSVSLGAGGFETFTLSRELFYNIFSAYHYGENIGASMQLVSPTNAIDSNGNKVYENIDEIVVDSQSSRIIAFAIKITIGGYYNFNGVFVESPTTYYFDFILNSTLPISDASFKDERIDGTVYSFYVPIIETDLGCTKTYDYRLAAYLLEGLKIVDYPNGTQTTMDFTGSTVMSNLTILSVKLGQTGGSEYELIVYNNKLLFIGTKASPDKRSENLEIQFQYVGANGKAVMYTRVFEFSSSTAEEDVYGVK